MIDPLIDHSELQERMDEVASHLEVKHGSPTDEELAAVITVIAATAAHREHALHGRRLASGPNLWATSDRLARNDLGHGYR